MCSRYNIEPVKDGWRSLKELLTPTEIAALQNIEARPDIRPTQAVPAIRWAKGEPAPGLVNMRWGFIPFWWKNEKPPQSTFNARSEDAPGKPMWRDAVRRSRCLIPATGWYEWVPVVNTETGELTMKPDGKPKRTPIEIRYSQSPAICFAGLWSRAVFKGETIETCTILTRAAVQAILQRGHDRMPVIVHTDDYRTWLDPRITDLELFEHVTTTDPSVTFEIFDRDEHVDASRHQISC